MVVHVGEHGVVDLQHEAGLDHFEIFLAHRAGDREHVVALAGVVLVGGVVADARRRDRGEEHVLGGRRRGGGFQVVEIAPHGGVAAIGDRLGAGMSGRADGAARKFRRHEFREAVAVAAEPDRLIERVGPRLEPGEPLQAVVGPAGFAVLAVIDDVDAGLGLARDDVRHRVRELALMRVAVRGVGIARGVEQRLGPDQAADMGGEDAVFAAFHARNATCALRPRVGELRKSEHGLRRGASGGRVVDAIPLCTRERRGALLRHSHSSHATRGSKLTRTGTRTTTN